MEFIQFRRSYSRNILFRMVILASAAAGIFVWKLDFISDVYFRNQLTATGLIINGGIVALFLLGIVRMIHSFIMYGHEEKALMRLIENLKLNLENPLNSVPLDSIVARRFQLMQQLYEQRAPINHSALASTLIAAESTRTSLPKFINNVLILTGVFGTIVSLSIALIGASNLIESVDAGGMGLVIHGMSTALSTTITAILCYLYFGYFYIKLADTQTNLISAVEQVTAGFLIPRFHVDTDSVLYEFSGLIRSLQSLVNQMAQTQSSFENVENRLEHLIDQYRGKVSTVSEGITNIQGLLRDGFRLPENR